MSQDCTHFYNQAIDAIEAGQLEKAISCTESALTEDSRDSLSWQLYVQLLTAAGRTEDAATAKATLATLGLSAKETMMIEAGEKLAAGKCDEAIHLYQQAATEIPDDPEIHTSLALALFQDGQSDAAIEAGTKAVQLAPTDSRANYALGHILRLEGRIDEALDALTRAVEAESDFMPAVYEQGMILAEKAQWHQALAKFERFAGAHPDDENARIAIHKINQELGRTDTF